MRSTRAIFVCACAGMLLFGITLITLGSLASALREKFELDAVQSGVLFSILPIGILAGSLLFGPFSDRYGYKIILLLSCLFIFTGFQGVAFASTSWMLKLCVFMFGLGGGAINGATNAVVSDISERNKGANLSLLGVFFAVGGLGMPSLLALLETRFTVAAIVSAIGCIPLAVALLCTLTRFPLPKQSKSKPFSHGVDLLREGMLITIGFCLFCVSSFEAIINNWTTTYLTEYLSIPNSKALFALSLYVGGMAGTRVLLGSVFRHTPASRILMISFLILVVGCAALRYADTYTVAAAGLTTIGIGLAAGFPVMLGFVGEMYAAVSGTAFSIVLTIALLGNMLVNLVMGKIVEEHGIAQLTTVAFVMIGALAVLTTIILKKIEIKHI